MKCFKRIGNGLGWLLNDGWNKGGQCFSLTRQAPPFTHAFIGRFKDCLEKSVLSAQLISSSIAVAIAILGKSEFALMNGCDINLNLLEMFTLTKVHTHFAASDLR